MSIYMNDVDPHACEWLRELQRDGLIPQGVVDERSICEVQPADLVGFRHAHFFTGIGGWPAALQLTGWPADISTFTGSPPCQPFSAAGKQKGTADERHLWPEYFRIIRNVRPLFAFGEQVEAAVRHGWLDGVQADLESEGYTFWPLVLGAHSGGAPHIRLRFFFVAFRNDTPAVLAARRHDARGVFHPASIGRTERRSEPDGRESAGGCGVGRMADTDGEREGAVGGVRGWPDQSQPDGSVGWLGDTGRELGGRRVAGGPGGGVGAVEVRPVEPRRHGAHGGLGDTDGRGLKECQKRDGSTPQDTANRYSSGADSGGSGDGLDRTDHRLADANGRQSGDGGVQPGGEHRQQPADGGVGGGADGVALGNTVGQGLQVGECDGRVQRRAGRPPAGQAAVVSGDENFWSACDVIRCRDNKWRRIPAGSAESVFFGLASRLLDGMGGGGTPGGGHGEKSFPLSFEKIEGRGPVLKGLGNAIIPAIAAEFVTAVMEVLGIEPESW